MKNEAEEKLGPQIVEAIKALGLIESKEVKIFEEILLTGKITAAHWKQYAEKAADRASKGGSANGQTN